MLHAELTLTMTPTERRQKVLGFMAWYQFKHGRPPTFAEINDEVGFEEHSTSVVEHYMKQLIEEGYLIRLKGGGARSYAVPGNWEPEDKDVKELLDKEIEKRDD